MTLYPAIQSYRRLQWSHSTVFTNQTPPTHDIFKQLRLDNTLPLTKRRSGHVTPHSLLLTRLLLPNLIIQSVKESFLSHGIHRIGVDTDQTDTNQTRSHLGVLPHTSQPAAERGDDVKYGSNPESQGMTADGSQARVNETKRRHKFAFRIQRATKLSSPAQGARAGGKQSRHQRRTK